MIINQTKRESKTDLAKKLGVSRSSLYYQPKRDKHDEEMKQQILIVMGINPGYGHKRIALEFRLNPKRIKRIMRKYDLKPYRRRAKKPRKPDDEGQASSKWQNQIIGFCPIRPDIVWASDFTYISFQGSFIYLATIIDVYTREIIGWNISRFHDTNLVLGALKHAIEKTGIVSVYLHSDQGSEYEAKVYEEYILSKGIIISRSHKSSPWENAFQESFYSHFKVDLGYTSRFDTEVELIEEIYQTIYYYNHQRIQTSLKMPPVVFKQIVENRLDKLKITV